LDNSGHADRKRKEKRTDSGLRLDSKPACDSDIDKGLKRSANSILSLSDDLLLADEELHEGSLSLRSERAFQDLPDNLQLRFLSLYRLIEVQTTREKLELLAEAGQKRNFFHFQQSKVHFNLCFYFLRSDGIVLFLVRVRVPV